MTANLQPEERHSVQEALRSIRHTLNFLVCSTLVLFVLTGALAFKTYTEAQRNHDSLCAVRADLQTRIDQGEAFIKDHPEGFAGIPAAVIQQQLDGQKQTVAALSGLDC